MGDVFGLYVSIVDLVSLFIQIRIFNVEHLFMRWFRFVHLARVRALSPQSHRRLPKVPNNMENE